jgi:hypothetical protein
LHTVAGICEALLVEGTNLRSSSALVICCRSRSVVGMFAVLYRLSRQVSIEVACNSCEAKLATNSTVTAEGVLHSIERIRRYLQQLACIPGIERYQVNILIWILYIQTGLRYNRGQGRVYTTWASHSKSKQSWGHVSEDPCAALRSISCLSTKYTPFHVKFRASAA